MPAPIIFTTHIELVISCIEMHPQRPYVMPLPHILCSLQPIVHFGFIPAVILLGMLTTKPRPSLGQLLWLG